MRVFAHPHHLLFVTMTFCSGGEQPCHHDSTLFCFTPQILSANAAIEEPHIDCPPPLVVTTFLHKPICVHPCLGEKLTVANTLLERQGFTQASQLGVQQLTGFRHTQTSLHGQGLAIDIDAAANPYLIHERNETKLDEALVVVYERIAQFILGRASVLPHLGANSQLQEARRTYVTRLYTSLTQESAAMQRYFVLMQDGPQLRDYVHTPLGSQHARLATTFLSILPKEEENSPQILMPRSTAVPNVLIDQIRLCMMSDWMTLTGQAGPKIVALPPDDARLPGANVYLPYPPETSSEADNPAKGETDRPFDAKGEAYPRRSPLNGFLTLRKELVLALIDAELRWGALDFGPTSGDLMHFDSRETSCSSNSDRN